MILDNGKEAVPIGEFKFQDYDGAYKQGEEKRPNSVYMTCKNHQGMLYSSKNPYQRGLHFLGVYDGEKMTGLIECDCDFSDLLVIVEDWEECK